MTSEQYQEALGALLSAQISEIFNGIDQGFSWEMCEEHLALALLFFRNDVSFSTSGGVKDLKVIVTIEDGDDSDAEWRIETKTLSELIIKDIKFWDGEKDDYRASALKYRAAINGSLDIIDAWIASLPPSEEAQ